MINCSCGRSVLKKGLNRHLKTPAHLKGLGAEEPNDNIEMEIDEGSVETEHLLEDEDYGIEDLNENDDYLADFGNDKFEKEVTKDELAEIKRETSILREKQKLDALKNKESKKFKKDIKEVKEDDDDIFSKDGSLLLGSEKRFLLAKVLQYKSIFKKELCKFKIKKTASCEEMKKYIEEMEIIVSIDSTEAFVMDGIYSALQMVEGVSSNTQLYDISGLSNILRSNLQFQSVCKQLYVKYGTFARCPPEGQLVFIVATSAYICRSVNLKRKQHERQHMGQPV